MKTLIIVRHAKSSWKDSSLADHERPLNKRGHRDAPFMSKLMHGKFPKIDGMVASPARRALLTALYFADTYGVDEKDIEISPSLYLCLPEVFLNQIHQFPDHWQSAFVFGHNPEITILANRFSDQPIENVPTCGILHLECPEEDWSALQPGKAELKAFYYPKQYF